ncbi:MAG: 2-dehydropantoate 2-reductase [Dehalococcoidales bacterium]|nr:2-dehydropantoate 2-reductase [Dehalococcoidales bacterium]
MRHIIYGAGGIGSIMGGHLVRTGHEAVLIGRPGHVNAINKNGLKLVTPTGTHSVQIPAVTAPDQLEFRPDDVILLCVKGQDTEGAMRDLKKCVDDIPVFCFQNGVRNEEIVSEYFARVYGVMVRVGAVYLTDGEVIARRDPPGWYIIGRYPTGTDDLAEAVAVDLREAGYFIKTVTDAMPYKWGKLMANLGNAVGAITNGSWESTGAIYRAVADEARAVVEKAGIEVVSQEQVAKDWPEITAPLKGQLNTEAQSSTWQSLARHQGDVETEFLNGEIVRVAARLGMKAPLNEKFVSITKEMAARHETPGKYTPEELSGMLGI